jgi:hypothetical protein
MVNVPASNAQRIPSSLILDSRVVAFEDGVYSRYPIPRSLTGVQPCRLTSRSSSIEFISIKLLAATGKTNPALCRAQQMSLVSLTLGSVDI